MLAPVLARLLEIPGVAEARVECTGTYFLVAGDEPALGRALAAVRDVLGPSSRPLDDPRAAVELARRARGELWFSPSEIRGLSYVEGRILAARVGDAVAAKIALEGGAREQLHEAVRAEILAALDHAHDTGGRSSTGWFWEEWPRIAERAAARLSGSMPPVLCAEVRSALAAHW